jgi:hypothetical protein
MWIYVGPTPLTNIELFAGEVSGSMATRHLDRIVGRPQAGLANPRLTSGGVALDGDVGSRVLRVRAGLVRPLDFFGLLVVPSDLVFEVLFQSRRRGFCPEPSGSCRRPTVIGRRWMFQFLSLRMPFSNLATPGEPRAVPALNAGHCRFRHSISGAITASGAAPPRSAAQVRPRAPGIHPRQAPPLTRTPRVPEGVMSHPSAPQFASSQAVISE